jgi:Ca2+-transporting ATPase
LIHINDEEVFCRQILFRIAEKECSQMDLEGLTSAEAAARLERFGPNMLPEPTQPSVAIIFLKQFLSPLIYILLASALVSLIMADVKDAIFIGAVLVLNGIIGTIQEYSAGKAAAALRRLEQAHASVIRNGERQEIEARLLVPGDVVLLEAGGRVPADIRLIEAEGLRCDESLLTGESEPARKEAYDESEPEAKSARAFTGTMVTRGRATGEVTATGLATEFGKIAAAIAHEPAARPPLLVRLEAFSKSLAIAVFLAILLLVGAGLARGMSLEELFMVSVGLAVSAIPEGLPVAITIALAIAMRRMARRNVIMRNMPAIESLGSCTMIATDKTGTLTMNELTVTDVTLPDGATISFELRDGGAPGDGRDLPLNHDHERAREKMARLLQAAVLPRSEERRVGKECRRLCRSRWSPYH